MVLLTLAGIGEPPIKASSLVSTVFTPALLFVCLCVCSLKAPIAMGYITPSKTEAGTAVAVEVRGNSLSFTVAVFSIGAAYHAQ